MDVQQTAKITKAGKLMKLIISSKIDLPQVCWYIWKNKIIFFKIKYNSTQF